MTATEERGELVASRCTFDTNIRARGRVNGLETPEKVVTGPLWRVDDDLKRMEKEGFGGTRYPATLWTRPFVSSLDSSSSTRS